MKFVPKTILTITSVAAFAVGTAMVTGLSLAAPAPPPPNFPAPPPGLPIDNGILAMVFIAVAYALHKTHQIKKHKKAQM